MARSARTAQCFYANELSLTYTRILTIDAGKGWSLTFSPQRIVPSRMLDYFVLSLEICLCLTASAHRQIKWNRALTVWQKCQQIVYSLSFSNAYLTPIRTNSSWFAAVQKCSSKYPVLTILHTASLREQTFFATQLEVGYSIGTTSASSRRKEKSILRGSSF